ncbi:MAG: hypothetical protein ABH803_04250 [Candidatus Micrarchaeota archaeon]
MITNSRARRVRFVDEKIYQAYLKLKSGKTEDINLAENIDSAINALKQNPFCGIKIPGRVWPKEYLKKYGIDNLRKYDLPDGWRLIYFLAGDEIEIVSIILEWFDHKNYEKRFGYKNK